MSATWARNGGCRRAAQAGGDQAGDECRKGPYVLADARRFERAHVSVALLHRDDRPRIAARGQHHVHEESPHAAVAVHVRMDVHQGEVTEHDPHGRFDLTLESSNNAGMQSRTASRGGGTCIERRI